MQTKKNGHTILLGEDELEVRSYLEMALKCMGYQVELAQNGEEVLSYFASSRPAVSAILLDLLMPRRDGIETLHHIRNLDSTLPVIVISGASSPTNIVNAMKNGATDFLCKPITHEDLGRALNKVLDSDPGLCVPKAGAPVLAKSNSFSGNNPKMREIQAMVALVGSSEAPVLIQGETGSGKEVLARELHAHSPRADKIFLKLNCAALPSELVESELFGYERGAFTGAFQKKTGMFEIAEGGTIFLDEIGDMDIRLQAKLLQVLQDREFQRIGGKELIKVDVRVMAATHRDLEQAIVDRTFREDLYYRLNVINFRLPPLRERQDEIVGLTEYLLAKYAVPGKPLPAITHDLKHALLTYHWPGNVRELENVMRSLTILRDPDLIMRELHLKTLRKPLFSKREGLAIVPPTHVSPHPTNAPMERDSAVANTPILEQVKKAKQQAESEAILTALTSTRWNRKHAAALLKIDYKRLLYKMKRLGLEDDPTCSTSEPDQSSQEDGPSLVQSW